VTISVLISVLVIVLVFVCACEWVCVCECVCACERVWGEGLIKCVCQIISPSSNASNPIIPC